MKKKVTEMLNYMCKSQKNVNKNRMWMIILKTNHIKIILTDKKKNMCLKRAIFSFFIDCINIIPKMQSKYNVKFSNSNISNLKNLPRHIQNIIETLVTLN